MSGAEHPRQRGGAPKEQEAHSSHYLPYTSSERLLYIQGKDSFDNSLLKSSTHTNDTWLRTEGHSKNTVTEPQLAYFPITEL